VEDVHADRADLPRRAFDFDRLAGAPVLALLSGDCRLRGAAGDGGVGCTDAAAAPTTRPRARPATCAALTMVDDGDAGFFMALTGTPYDRQYTRARSG